MIQALIATILIEFLFYSLIIRKNLLSLGLYSILINCLTNPLANLFYDSDVSLFLIELVVFIVEIFLIKILFKISYKKALLISIIANSLSFFIGLFLL